MWRQRPRYEADLEVQRRGIQAGGVSQNRTKLNQARTHRLKDFPRLREKFDFHHYNNPKHHLAQYLAENSYTGAQLLGKELSMGKSTSCHPWVMRGPPTVRVLVEKGVSLGGHAKISVNVVEKSWLSPLKGDTLQERRLPQVKANPASNSHHSQLVRGDKKCSPPPSELRQPPTESFALNTTGFCDRGHVKLANLPDMWDARLAMK